MDVLIRPETPEDHQAIFDIIQRAFAPMPYAGGDEQLLPNRFRDANILACSLVAESDSSVIGQITLTPALSADGSTGWYAIGPLAVEPALKHQGIGSMLMRAAIQWMREQAATGCVLVGNPDYYSRFGFRLYPDLAPAGEPAEFYQMLSFDDLEPNHVVHFHPLFYSDNAERTS